MELVADEMMAVPPPRPSTVTSPSGSNRMRRWRFALTIVSFATVGAIGLKYGSEVTASLGRIRRIRFGRLAAAVALEVVSIALMTALHRRLVQRAGAVLSRRRAAAVVCAGSAIALSVPGGPVLANAYSYRQWRRRGLDHAVVGWVVTTVALISTIALTVFSVVGARSASGIDWWTISAGFGVMVLLAVVVLLVGAPTRLGPIAVALLRAARRVIGRPADPIKAWATTVHRLSAVDIRRRDWVVLFGFSLGNWAADCASLYLSARALNAHLTFTSVVIAYAIGQAILVLPLTPGGIGVYEAGVTAALTRVGVRRGKALSSVLMYRFISFWAVLLVGWLCWLVLHVGDRRLDRQLAGTGKLAPCLSPRSTVSRSTTKTMAAKAPLSSSLTGS